MPPIHPQPDILDQVWVDCIAACSECYETCEKMIFQHCLKLGGRHAGQAHLTLMADCAQICRTAANFMIRGSTRHLLTCGICAAICEACADDCGRLGEMDECVRACRQCADSCRAMVS